MNNDDDDDNETVGYGRPPRKHQFKKGQSGCPSGGQKQKQEKAKALSKKKEEEERKQDKTLVGAVRRLAGELIPVRINGHVVHMPRLEATLRKSLDRALQPDAGPRETAQALNVYKHAKLLDAASDKPRPSVLVVYPTMTQDEWEKRTEGELLPKNPLEGIPGAEGFLDTERPRGRIPDSEDN